MTVTPEQHPHATAASGHAQGSDHAVEQDLVALFGRSTAVFASLAGPAHMVEAANDAFFAAIGGDERARTGLPLGQLIPELAKQGFISLLDQVYRTGKPYIGYDARIVWGEDAAAREAFFDFIYEPRLDAAGNVTGVRVIGVETTQVKHAQQLTAEHRALLEQIARQAPLADVLDGMARVIERLAPHEVKVSILLADSDGRHLRHGAAPSLPDFYNQAIDGIATGEGVGSCGTAAHRRRIVIVSDIATDPFWDDFRDLANAAGVAACWSAPILARDRSLLGTFAMYHTAPRMPQEADLALVRVFADTAALAIERDRAEQARRAAEAKEKAARDDLAFLLRAGTRLTSGLDYTQTLQRLASSCTPTLAPLCAVDVIDAGRVRRIATAAPTAAQEELLARHIPVYDAADDAVARVLAAGIAEVARRTPTGPGPWTELGVTGYLCIPLLDRGRAFGTLTLLSTSENVFDGHTVALAEEVARRAASAALNARQYTQRAALARDLQAGLLLPEVPEVPGADVATYYHPAGEGLDVGGDFYDLFPLSDGRWAFLLGDVCGRGAMAATTTALVRHTARAVARFLPEPDGVVRAVNQALLDRPDSHGSGFVTLVYGHLAPAGDSGLDIALVRAGHTVPLHIDGSGTVSEVDVPGFLLGMETEPRLPVHHLHLELGESLLLYTDGITEARNADRQQFGEEGLMDALRTRHGRLRSAQTIVDTVITAVRAFAGPHDGDDDQAALALTADLR